MKENKSSNNKFVYPGDFLGYEEEFLPGKNAFVDDEGKVCSSAVGLKSEDKSAHEVSVDSKRKEVKIVEKGCVVIGVVSLVKPFGVMVDLKYADFNGEQRIVHNNVGSLPVFNMAYGFVKNTEDLFRVGDIIKARVVSVTSYGVELDTKDPAFGVIKAFGIKSRMPLHLIAGKLRDPVTGATELRKVSSDYLLR